MNRTKKHIKAERKSASRILRHIHWGSAYKLSKRNRDRMNRKTRRTMKRATRLLRKRGGNGNKNGIMTKRNQKLTSNARTAVSRNAQIANMYERKRQEDIKALNEASARNERESKAFNAFLAQQPKPILPGMTTGQLSNFIRGNIPMTTVYNEIVETKKPYITNSFKEHMKKYANGM
jgi:hypothetical protein